MKTITMIRKQSIRVFTYPQVLVSEIFRRVDIKVHNFNFENNFNSLSVVLMSFLTDNSVKKRYGQNYNHRIEGYFSQESHVMSITC